MYPTRKILNILLAAACGALLAGGCSVYDRDTCQDGFGSRVMLDLVVPSSSHATKADGMPDGPWSGEYNYDEDGDEYDNYIDLDNLQILFYKTDGATYVAKLSDYDIIEITGSGKYETNHAYRINGEMKTAEGQALAAGSYKVMVLANCPQVSASTTLANLQVDNFFDDGTYIPMWGMKEMAFKFENGKVDDLGKISLLRATAKLNVVTEWNDTFKGERSAEELQRIKIKSVELMWGAKAVNCLPAVTGMASLTNTEGLQQEACFNPVTAEGAVAAYSPVKAFALNEDSTAGSLVVPEYTIGNKPEGVAADATAVMKIVITEEFGTENAHDLTFYLDPTANIKKTEDDTAGPGRFVRNHLYRFKIVYYTTGKLYVNPTVAPWENAESLTYKMDMSTNMRLFDSWLYRYDTDGKVFYDKDENGNLVWRKNSNDKFIWEADWSASHMAVSSGRVESPVAPEIVAGRPLRSPQIQLVTSGSGTFELVIDNSDFEIVRANKNDVGVVTSYDASTDDKLTIAAGENVNTYFYIVPKEGSAPDNPVAKVSLIYNDPVVGPQEVTYNYNVLPGYSDDSAEVWAYYFAPDDYNIDGKLKMYYQDATHPLVPTPVQN